MRAEVIGQQGRDVLVSDMVEKECDGDLVEVQREGLQPRVIGKGLDVLDQSAGRSKRKGVVHAGGPAGKMGIPRSGGSGRD